MYEVIAYGLDYVRYCVFSDADIAYVARLLPFLEMNVRNFHGSRFIDVTGKQIEIMRLFIDVDSMVKTIAMLLPVNRIDVFVDVRGHHLQDISQPGTVIMNNKRVETVYSSHLSDRGNVTVFARAYDARAAGHYDVVVTRFECEFKREMARALLGTEGWKVHPVGLALRNIAIIFNIKICIDGILHVDFNAPRRRYEHNRERFYARYGKSIVRDIETMGAGHLYEYILACLKEKSDAKEQSDKTV